MLSPVYRVFDRLGAVLLPPRCVLCQGPGAVPGRDLCADCEADLPWLHTACIRCGLPQSSASASAAHGDACERCRNRTQPHRICHAPFLYQFPLTELVPALKYQGALACARVLGTLLAESVARACLHGDVDVVVPMPLHRSRLVERGFNQSAELARYVTATLPVELDIRALQRSRATEPQVGLPRAERSRNVRGAFVAHPSLVTGRHVALLDDVVTTGATVREAARTMLAAGAARVDVWCVARATA
ncbi:MAG TPA: ComF family protein [Steroidobacteraceae bacterium]|nr:ComF family protein [Steroidobacteraceae bacterium]